VVLEGESLLNDASALLLYKLAVGAVAAGSFSVTGAIPTFALVVVGSVVIGWLVARPVGLVTERIQDAPSSVIFQFVITFGIWLAAEHLGLSGVVTIVIFGLTVARRSVSPLPARLRVPSFAIWETVTFVLNVMAFTLIGLQLRPILEALSSAERLRFLKIALVILAVVVVVRIAWRDDASRRVSAGDPLVRCHPDWLLNARARRKSRIRDWVVRHAGHRHRCGCAGSPGGLPLSRLHPTHRFRCCAGHVDDPGTDAPSPSHAPSPASGLDCRERAQSCAQSRAERGDEGVARRRHAGCGATPAGIRRGP
jgi:hypothetical protein